MLWRYCLKKELLITHTICHEEELWIEGANNSSRMVWRKATDTQLENTNTPQQNAKAVEDMIAEQMKSQLDENRGLCNITPKISKAKCSTRN